MSVGRSLEEWNELLRKKGRVEFRLVGGKRCEFGCYQKQSGGGLPGVFPENGWVEREESRTLSSGKATRFRVISKSDGRKSFRFLLTRTPSYLLIKPYSESGNNQAAGAEAVERFRSDIEKSGIDEVFCAAFPVSSAGRALRRGPLPGPEDRGERPPRVWKADKLNNRADFLLCDEGVAAPEKIVEILKEEAVFPVDISGILLERYAKMRANYRELWAPGDGKWKQKNGLDIVDGKQYKDALLRVPMEAQWGNLYNIGHDLPIWCRYHGGCPDPGRARRIMIISQDPLRRGFGEAGQLLLSSPWALHSRNYLRDDLPHHIIHEMLAGGAVVYVTDFYKLYATGRSDGGENVFLEDDRFREKMRAVLNREIQAFAPHCMITYGRDVAGAMFGKIRTEYEGRECWVASHPSYVARLSGNMDDRVNYFLEGLFPGQA